MAVLANSIFLPAFLDRTRLPTSRRAIEHYIEALIHSIDQLDGDVDPELSLGWGADGSPAGATPLPAVDLEADYLVYGGFETASFDDESGDQRASTDGVRR